MIMSTTYSIFSKIITIVLVLSMACCAPVISRQLREQARPDLTFSEVLGNPERYKGQMIILSGIILDAKHTKEGTLFEILQTPADFSGKPKDIDESEGRFLALDNRYPDINVYRRRREVTIAGTIEGKEVQALGKIEYGYPLIHVNEIYLWPVQRMYPHPHSYYAYERHYWRRTRPFPRRFRRLPPPRKTGEQRSDKPSKHPH